MRYLFQMRTLIQVTLGVILIVGLLSHNYAQTSNNGEKGTDLFFLHYLNKWCQSSAFTNIRRA